MTLSIPVNLLLVPCEESIQHFGRVRLQFSAETHLQKKSESERSLEIVLRRDQMVSSICQFLAPAG